MVGHKRKRVLGRVGRAVDAAARDLAREAAQLENSLVLLKISLSRIWFWRAMKFKVLLRKRGGARARAAGRQLFLEIRPFDGSCFLKPIYHAS